MTIFTNPWIFYYSEWSIRSCVDVPQCNSQFLAMIMKKPFFLLPHHAAQTLYMSRAPHHAWALKISSVLHRFQSSEGSLDQLLQMYAPHYSLQCQVQRSCSFSMRGSQSPHSLLISSHLSLSSTVQHSHRNACCQRKRRCFIAAHNQQHFQDPIAGAIPNSNMILWVKFS